MVQWEQYSEVVCMCLMRIESENSVCVYYSRTKAQPLRWCGNVKIVESMPNRCPNLLSKIELKNESGFKAHCSSQCLASKVKNQI